MFNSELDYNDFAIAVVIPAYKVEAQIKGVLNSLPGYITHIIVVNDCSPDATRQQVITAAELDRRIILIDHEQNQGVGGALVSGFQKALELQAQIVVKIDGDGQMDSRYLSDLLIPLILGEADYTKGNRFHDFQTIRSMPFVRRIGNLGLSFLTKTATGYWNCFGPTNGFLAIRSELLRRHPLEKIDSRFFFEISMFSYIYLENANIKDIPVPAIYKNEYSNLSVPKALFEVPAKLITTFLRRIHLKYYLDDFSILSVYLISGIPLLGLGLLFGKVKWIHDASLNIPAPVGTVMLATLPVILGIQILLSAIEIDLNTVPHVPLLKPLTDLMNYQST